MSISPIEPDRDQITVPPDGRPMEDQPAWRRDFPIDVPQDHYVARRDFTKFMVLTSFAFFVGQLTIGVQNLLRRRTGQPPAKLIARLADIPVGGVLTFTYPDAHDPCLLLRLGDKPTDLVAYSQKCTHLSCAVVPDMAHRRLDCPCHEGVFDMATGRQLQGPPRRPLPRIALDIRGDEIYATAVEERTGTEDQLTALTISCSKNRAPNATPRTPEAHA